jgi:hypothetical protein
MQEEEVIMQATTRTRCVPWCLALVVVAGCGGSAGPTTPSAGPTASSGVTQTTVAGLVNATAAATPSGLSVTVVGTDLSAAVDSSGYFQIEGIPSGDVQLSFSGGTASATAQLSNVRQNEFIELQVELSGSTATIVSQVRSQGKVSLCHRTEAGVYHLIDVSVNAEATHRAHGDAKPGEPVPADPTKVFGESCQLVGPAVRIEKSTNGKDADVAPGPTILVGDTVTWEYVVTNTGGIDLTNVQVVDDQGVTVDCSGQTTLAAGLSMTCTGSGVATLGQYSNLGTVTAESTAGSVTVTDSDASHYLGQETLPPGIKIKKFTNGKDADQAPGPVVLVGAPVTWEYVVTNTGPIDLTDVQVVDDQGVIVDCSGQTTLAEGMSMTCTGSGVATLGQYTNVGTVTANSASGPVSDSDVSHYLGQTTVPVGKVQLCHRTGNGTYHLIEVSVNAEPAHRAHGDGMIGEPVPGSPGKFFGAGCTIQ